MKTHYLLLIGFLGLALFNPQATNAQDNPLSKLKVLEGEWEGTGWVRMPQSETIQFNQKESIEFKLNGLTLMINGKGFDQKSGDLEFEALAMMYADASGKVKMTSHTNDNRHTEADVEIGDDFLNWWFPVPNGGTIKYEITFDASNWKEKGSYSPDGNQWYPFMEMTLTKN